MDQLYATDGYVEAGYAVYTADAIALTASESSVEAVVGIVHDVQIDQLTLFEIGVTANLTLRPPAYLESNTQMTAQVNYTGAAVSTLDNIINLLMQGDRFRDNISALDSAADCSAALSTIFDHTAQLPVEAVFVCSAERVKQTECSIESETAVEALGGKLIELGELYIDSNYFDIGYFEQSPTLAAWAELEADAELVVQAIRFTAEFVFELDVDYIVEFAADLTAPFAFDIEENIIKSTAVDLQSDIQVQTEEQVIRSTGAELNSVVQLESVANLIAVASIEIDSEIAIIVVSEALRYSGSDMQVTASIFATAIATKEIVASVQAESTADATLTPIRNAVSAIECAVDLAAITGVVQTDVQSAINSEFTTLAVPMRLAGIASEIAAEAILLGEAARTAEFVAYIDLVATLAAEVQIFSGVASSMDVESAMVATAERTRDNSSDILSTSTVSAVTLRIQTSTADSAIQSEMLVSADRTRSTTAALDAEFTIDTEFTVIESARADISTESQLSAVSDRIRDTNAAVDADTDIQVELSRIRITSVDISSAFTATIDNRGLGITEERTYRIPAERRVYQIPRESREYRIPRETRTWKVT